MKCVTAWGCLFIGSSHLRKGRLLSSTGKVAYLPLPSICIYSDQSLQRILGHFFPNLLYSYMYMAGKKSRLSSWHCPSYIRCVGFVAAKETWYLVLFEVPFLLVIQSVLINSNTECLWNGIFIFGEKQDIVTVAVLISHVSTDVLSALILFLLNVHGVWRGENNISMFSLHLRKDIYRKLCMFCVLRVILKAATSIGTG